MSAAWRISAAEMAERMGVSQDTVYCYIRAGLIPASPAEPGGQSRIVLRADFERWLERGSEPKPLTAAQIEEAAYRGTQRALSEYVPTVRFEPAPFRVVRPVGRVKEV